MKKVILFTTVILLLLVLAGCGSDNGGEVISYNFKQGTGELNYRFVEKAPPEEIYPISSFKMILELDNQMAYDISNGQVKIRGLDPKFFKVEPLEQNFNLLGRSFSSPEGEKNYLEFSGMAGPLFQNSDEYEGNYFLVFSFDSELDFQDNICLNPNLYDVYDSGCSVETEKSYSGQGGSLAVTDLEEIINPAGVGGQMELRLTLNNVGNGLVGKVNLISAQLGGQEIPCEIVSGGVNQNISNLRTTTFTPEQDPVQMVCRAFLRDRNSYTSTLALHFTYDYSIVEENQLFLINPSKRR